MVPAELGSQEAGRQRSRFQEVEEERKTEKMKIKTTYEKLFGYAVVASAYLAEKESRKDTKLGYAIITRMDPRVSSAQKRYQLASEEISIDHCATDEKGIVLKDGNGNFEFTKEGLKERNKKRQELFESVEIEVEVYIATQVPDDLTPAEYDALEGFVLPQREETTSTDAE